ILQDHHMCYGYHLYCAALLFFQDRAFAKKYGPMARLVAKDYAEWDPKSKLFCRFRNLDPWCGHSWSGGLGGDRGNGQESSSEAMQGYGAMFLLGEALGDKEMRDAGAFAWATEARGIAEYYFDRGHRNFPKEWPHTMSTNIHTEGLGFWTWFSGNPFWMHAIQWLPMSPLLCYLGEDPAYAAADFQQMWKTHEGGKGWDGYLGKDSGPVSIAVNYLALSDPVEAAKVFAKLWKGGSRGLRSAEAGHMYWRLHALQRLGRHRFDAWADLATAQAFGEGDDPAKFAWVAFNAADQEKTVRCFFKGKQVAEFKAAPGRLTVMRGGKTAVDAGPMEPVPEAPATAKKDGLVIEPEVALMHQLDTQKFTAYRLRGGKKEKVADVAWSVRQGKTVGGAISAAGVFTPKTGNVFDEPKTEIVAKVGGETASAFAVMEEARRVGKLTMAPQSREALKIGVGDQLSFTVEAQDQFSAWIDAAPEITVEGGKALKLEKTPGGARVTGAAVGKGALVATLG
ncbi:MAG: hypothetical protein J6333_04445, partial [Planctomycetes bacterium]|nr:hypothetical protein [Planctomycetota bacterium]